MFNLPLRNIVKKDDLFIQHNALLITLIELMDINGKGVVVVLEDRQPVGILTERDVVEILYKGVDLYAAVDQFAPRLLISTNGNRTLGYALNLMMENNIRRVVVTDDGNNFIGVITQKELLEYMEDDYYRSMIKVKHIVERLGYLISVTPDESLNDVLKKMVENKIGAVAVTQDDISVGIITERDILKLARHSVSLEDKVRTYMSTHLITANLDSSLVDIVKTMNDSNIRRVVIVNNQGIAVNIITIRDIMRNLDGDYNKFLERKLKNAKDVFNLLPEMLIEVTDTGEEQLIIWANEKALNRFGTEIIDKRVSEFIAEDTWGRIYDNLIKLNKIENIKLKKDNEIYELSGFLINTEGKMEKSRVQLIMRNITEEVRTSIVDHLTNIYNRRFMNECLTKEIAKSQPLNRKFSLVMCDIDDFKEINDSHGHPSGDRALIVFSEVLTDSLRDLDIVGRYGGDEFVIIMPETPNEIAADVTKRLRKKINEREFALNNEVKVKITASFGIATYPEDGVSSDDLLVMADARLYKVKSMGKNEVVCK